MSKITASLTRERSRRAVWWSKVAVWACGVLLVEGWREKAWRRALQQAMAAEERGSRMRSYEERVYERYGGGGWREKAWRRALQQVATAEGVGCDRKRKACMNERCGGDRKTRTRARLLERLRHGKSVCNCNKA